MSAKPQVLIVEDQVEYQKEIKNCLADEQFCGPKDIVGAVGTVEAAIELLESKAAEIDLILLDLNLPNSPRDPSPEKLSGKRILDVAKSLNGKSGVLIKVIIISGEDMVDVDATKELLYQQYAGTLVAIVQKAELAGTIESNLQLFFKDPMRDRLVKSQVNVLDDYDKIHDVKSDIQTKLDAACSLAICLLCNELDKTYGKLGTSDEFRDDLNGLVWKLKEDRFQANDKGKRFIVESKISSPGGWEAFLWRGSMEQHIQTLFRYRNDYAHLRAKPFRSKGKNAWKIHEDTLVRIESGHAVSQIIELIVAEILKWYLPWHEQVYRPWREKIK